MNKESYFSGILAGAIGGGLFLAFLLLFGLDIIPSLVIGVAGFAIALAFFRPKTASDAQPAPDNAILIREVMASGSAQQAEMTKIARSLPAGTIRRKLENLASLTGKIVDDVRQDPQDGKAAGRFLAYYADTAIRIATMYRDLTSRDADSPEIRQTGAKVERNLDILEKAFKLQLTKLQENDLMNLDAEMSVLESTLKMEGIDIDPNRGGSAGTSQTGS